jgi:hypothetical protein
MAISKPDLTHLWASGGARVTPSSSKIQQGWIAEIPPHQWENFAQYRQDQMLAHINQKGVPVWDALTTYDAAAAYVQGSDGNIYKSVAASGPSTTTQDPTTDVSKTYWTLAFLDPQQSDTLYLKVLSNGADIDDASVFRTNIGVYSKTEVDGLIVNPSDFVRIYEFNNIPTTNVGTIYVREMNSFWEWVATPYFTGYRSLNSGKLEFGWTPTPLPWQVEAIGGVLNEVDHGGLIARFRESGLETPIGSWVAGEYKIADLGGGDWRAPDMRNQFLRFTGTDADTANERALGSMQLDAQQRVQGSIYFRSGAAGIGTGALQSGTGAFAVSYSSSVASNSITRDSGSSSSGDVADFDNALTTRTSAETRGSNTAFLPVINL